MDNNKNIKSLINDLSERDKELNCLFAIDEILKDHQSDIATVINQIIEIIPSGWRFTDICRVLVLFNDVEYKSADIKKTELKISSDIVADKKKVGEIHIYYIKPVRLEKGIFIPEERKLLQNIAERLGNYISYKELKEIVAKKNPKKKASTPPDPLFEWLSKYDLPKEEIERITNVKIKFKKGETICKQGSFATYIMLLKEGLVKSSIEGSANKNFIFKIAKPFSFIGLTTLYGDNHYHFTSTAIIPSTIYLIEKTTFDNILKTNPRFYTIILNWYCQSFENIYGKLNCVANKQALGRIAETLLYLSDIFTNNIIENTITRKDIAELSGMSTENAVRILSELKKDDIISIKSSGIEIKNKSILKTISLAG